MTTDHRSIVAIPRRRVAVRVRGEGPPLVLLHGMGGRGDDFEHSGGEAFARRFTTYAPDARGHGESDPCDGGFRHADVARDTRAVLDALGVDRFFAIGVSLGGNALLHLAEAIPERIHAMVIVSSVARFPEQARAIMRAIDPDDPRRQADVTAPRGQAQARDILAHMRAFADDVDDQIFDQERLARITVPTLVIHGSEDPLYAQADVEAVARGLANGRLVVVEGGGHSPVFTERAPAFVEACLAFFDRHP